MKFHNKVAGYYKIEKVVNAGSALEFKEPITGWFPNMILNTGLDIQGTDSTNIIMTCLLGSGNTPPQATDLALVSSLGSVSATSCTKGNSSSPDYYKYATLVYRFGAGVATGNISEVAVGWGTASGQLLSRALILDELGDPTTITKLSDEVLDVTYQYRIYPSLADFTGGFTLTGNKGAIYTYTGRIANAETTMAGYNFGIYPPYPIAYGDISVYAYTGGLGLITATPTGGNGTKTGTNSEYVSGSYKMASSATFGLTDSNSGLGIRSIMVNATQGSWQFEFNTPILKTASDILTINTEVSWARA